MLSTVSLAVIILSNMGISARLIDVGMDCWVFSLMSLVEVITVLIIEILEK